MYDIISVVKLSIYDSHVFLSIQCWFAFCDGRSVFLVLDTKVSPIGPVRLKVGFKPKRRNVIIACRTGMFNVLFLLCMGSLRIQHGFIGDDQISAQFARRAVDVSRRELERFVVCFVNLHDR